MCCIFEKLKKKRQIYEKALTTKKSKINSYLGDSFIDYYE